MKRLGIAPALILAASVLLLQGGLAEAVDDRCPTGVCIDVGDDVTIKVTNALLGTDCLDSKGKPIHERVTLSVSGAPNTGAATAIFNPNVIRAYEAPSILTIHTTARTRPGGYTVEINGTGEQCGRYHGYTWRPYIRPKIDGERELWDFKGARPKNYPTEITLVATPTKMPPYRWLLGAGSRSLRFPNGQLAITTNTNTVKITGNFPTAPTDKPSVSVSVAAGASLPHDIEVRTPAALVGRGTHTADPKRGYRSVWQYLALDQFGYGLPATALPLRVVWTSPQVDVFPSNNWIRAAKGPRFLVNPHRVKLALFPQTSGDVPVKVGIPKPVEPNHGSTKVDCWTASVFLGGDATHPGVRVADQVWYRFLDHATTEGEHCP